MRNQQKVKKEAMMEQRILHIGIIARERVLFRQTAASRCLFF